LGERALLAEGPTAVLGARALPASTGGLVAMGCSSSKAQQRGAVDGAVAPGTLLGGDDARHHTQQVAIGVPTIVLKPAPDASAASQPPRVLLPTAPGEQRLPSPMHHIAHAPSAPAIRDASASPPAMSPPSRRTSGEPADEPKPTRRERPSRTMPASLFSACSCNGFKAIPEIHSLECSEASVAAFTMPGEAFKFQPPPDAVVTKFKNGDSERKIHLNIELSESELDRLNQMRQEAKAVGAEFCPSVTTMATRFLSRARMDPKKAVKLMKATQEWRQEYFKNGPVSDTEIEEDMKHGIVYFTGRDYNLRPAIVIRAARIPQQWYKDRCVDRFIRMLIFCMEYFARYMVVPGKIENLSVIVDLAGLGISQVPIGPLGEVYSVMSHHYIGRVYKFYVCNTSYMLSSIAGMVKGLLTDRQKQKLTMLDSVSELRKDFALHMLEEDLGGSRPSVTSFFPFPLEPGPYEAGHSGGPARDAVPFAHEVLSAAGALGKLWDPKLSARENCRWEFGPKAALILERCGVPVPREARFDFDRGCAFGLRVAKSLETFEPSADHDRFGCKEACKRRARSDDGEWHSAAMSASPTTSGESDGCNYSTPALHDTEREVQILSPRADCAGFTWCCKMTRL